METQQQNRKEKIAALRKALANMSEEQKQAFRDRGLIATVEGRTLSLTNTALCYFQANGTAPTVVGGYQQWRKAGRQVMKGEHSFLIWFPVGKKNDEGNIEDADKFFMASVFDVSQTEAKS